MDRPCKVWCLVTADEKILIGMAAARDGMRLAAFLRNAGMERAAEMKLSFLEPIPKRKTRWFPVPNLEKLFDAKIWVSMSNDEKEVIKRASVEESKSVSAFLRGVGLARAKALGIKMEIPSVCS